MHAALWLVVTLGAVAGCFLLMTAEFVAWMQVLIYVGAVVVLLLFGLMLTRAPIGPQRRPDTGNWFAALFVAVCTTAVLVVLLVDGFRTAMVDVRRHRPTTAEVLGESMFRYWVLPFEVLSVLLLSRSGRCHRAVPLPRQSTIEQEALMHLLPSAAAVGCLVRDRGLRRAGSPQRDHDPDVRRADAQRVNLSLVAFDVWLRDALHAGQSLAMFVITIAAAEIGLGLAIVLLVYRSRSHDRDRRTRSSCTRTHRRTEAVG